MAFGMNRDSLFPFLESIPDPFDQYNPCDTGKNSPRGAIQYRLSCLAKSYGIYIVANFGTVIFCNADEPCPPDGRFQYNTNVVFDNRGTIVSVYHKWNLFYESAFDFPAGPEYAIFETPFGTFATIICFDILFKEPAVTLVEKYNVRNFILPTAWRSILPEMSGIGYHESWSIRMGVNLLTAELHVPVAGFAGSVISAGASGAVKYSNHFSILSQPELLVADLEEPEPCHRSTIEIHKDGFANDIQSNTFEAKMESNLFTFSILTETSGSINLRTENLYCMLKYRFLHRFENELYAFGIFKGIHISSLNSSIEVCALVKCENSTQNSCGTSTRQAFSTFTEVIVTGEFTTNYIFPSVLLNDGQLAKDKRFELDESNNRGQISLSTNSPVLSTMLYTRDFDGDDNIRVPYYHKQKGLIEERNVADEWSVHKPISIQASSRTNNNILTASILMISLTCILSVSIFIVYRRNKLKREHYEHM